MTHPLRWEQFFDEVRGSSERTDPDYYENVIGRAVEALAGLKSAYDQRVFLEGFDSADRKLIRERLGRIDDIRNATPQDLASRRTEPQLGGVVDEVNAEVMAQLKKHPEWVYQLNPRAFEKLVAEIFKDRGCEVELTPQTRDGGRDVLVHFSSPAGRMLTIIECKRYAPSNKVGVDIVERFLFTISERDRANAGLIATTSSFSADAIARAREYQYRLQLRDFPSIKEWIGRYGTWVKDARAELWVPDASLNL